MKRPFIIGIGGTCSNVGKTMTAVLLLQHLSSGTEKWGAIKYTKTEFYTSLVDDKETLSRKDKDTGRFLEAGAGEVVWVKAPQRELADILPLALKRLSHNDGIIAEGNSAIEFLKPDIVIFMIGKMRSAGKQALKRLSAYPTLSYMKMNTGFRRSRKQNSFFVATEPASGRSRFF